ncbi:MAG: DUF4412 domain-containing protein [Ferruginibacter sp.]
MVFSKLILWILLPVFILSTFSCNSVDKKRNENAGRQTAALDTSQKDAAIVNENNNVQADPSVHANNSGDSLHADNADSMLTKGIAAMFGTGDSGLLKKLGGGKNMDSMMQKVQSLLGGKGGNPGDAISKSLLNFQLGQMSDGNPIKSVAKGMQQAQENGTAGPSKTYTAVYTAEQPDNYSVPVSGNGSVIMLQYSGGTIAQGKKDGLWKNIYISNQPQQWNVFTEGYVESSAINMKVHATSLASIHENYSINLNEQYKKFAKQYRTEAGRYESDVQVQKIGTEKMFGYNCTHVMITYTLKALGQTSHEQNDVWYSADVPGNPFVSPMIFENYSPAVVKKIMDAGCAGIPVKSLMKSAGSSYLMQLSSVTKKDLPSSYFSLPAAYQEDKNTALYDIQ